MIRGFGMNNTKPLSKCVDCGKKLPKPEYKDNKWMITCECGCRIVWSFPNVWKRVHLAGPLFTDNRIVQVA